MLGVRVPSGVPGNKSMVILPYSCFLLFMGSPPAKNLWFLGRDPCAMERAAGTFHDAAASGVPRRSKVRFAPTFFMPAAKRRDPLSPLRPSPNRPHCAGLRFDSGASRYFFVHKKVRFNRPFQKKDMTKKSCLSFGVSAALRPPPLGISMLGRAKPSLRNSSVLRTCELTAHQRHRPEGRR